MSAAGAVRVGVGEGALHAWDDAARLRRPAARRPRCAQQRWRSWRGRQRFRRAQKQLASPNTRCVQARR